MDNTQIAVDVFNKLAGEYQAKFMNVEQFKDSFDLFCNNIAREHADVLEIACGPGNITKYLLAKRPDFNILGTDLAPNMIHLAKINNPTATFQLMDARYIGKVGKQYDAVVCGFCFPYYSKEETNAFIRDASQILTATGVIYISTLEDDYSKSGIRTSSAGDQVYMYYHEADYLTATLLENGFHILGLTRKVYPAPDGTPTTDLVIVAGK
jgi:2-polyprenyl-3-methyl-5-hydroxy-6-metoxy-1,4-benzoquinol methylase